MQAMYMQNLREQRYGLPSCLDVCNRMPQGLSVAIRPATEAEPNRCELRSFCRLCQDNARPFEDKLSKLTTSILTGNSRQPKADVACRSPAAMSQQPLLHQKSALNSNSVSADTSVLHLPCAMLALLSTRLRGRFMPGRKGYITSPAAAKPCR